MQNTRNDQRQLYAGMHDGVCALRSTDAGQTWAQGQVTPASPCGSPPQHQRSGTATGVSRGV
jgi:hypothetical protein